MLLVWNCGDASATAGLERLGRSARIAPLGGLRRRWQAPDSTANRRLNTAHLRAFGRGAILRANMPKSAWFDWLTVFAIVLGPVLALMAQRVLDRLRENKKRRVGLYLALMATRGQPLAPTHVQALNSIDTVFNRRSDRAIRAAWQKWLAHVAADATAQGWGERFNDLKVELYQKIGSAVGYKYDIDYLKRQIYAPRGHFDADQNLAQIRQTLAKVLTADGLKVRIVASPAAIEVPISPRGGDK